MIINLKDGREAKIGVKYEYAPADATHQKEPVGTKVWVTLSRKGYKDVEFEGHAIAKGPDQFSRKQGRKWAMISLFKRDKENGQLLSVEDRRLLFNAVCPYFNGKSVEKPAFKKSLDKMLESKSCKKLEENHNSENNNGFWMDYDEWEDYITNRNTSDSILKFLVVVLTGIIVVMSVWSAFNQ